jgi:hypothetical protein
MLLLKPCPPCCTTAKADWPHVHVSKDFYNYSVDQKLVVLEQVIIDHPTFEDTLRPVIDFLKQGNDIAQ